MYSKYISLILLIFLLVPPVQSCKDIIACGDATKGDYNLLLKIRDPSRPGFQIICIVPENYSYTYHHPWTGKSIKYVTNHKYIGVTSINDTPPAIVKSGMLLTDVGLAFGDADTNSGWINPSKYAWDDFDWMRYAAENSCNIQEAIYYLTADAVDNLHATGVSENLFLLGPDKGYVIEADAYRYYIKELIDGVDILSNYPRELWDTQWFKTNLISSSFDAEVYRTVRQNSIIHLGSLLGVEISYIGEEFIIVRECPAIFGFIKHRIDAFKPVTININESRTVGDFRVTLIDIKNSEAVIHITTAVKAWQDEMFKYVNEKYGNITVKDMMNWSRIYDLDGLRPMCEKRFKYEGAAIYRIPNTNYKLLSGGWFSPNHACSSIYVPFHIVDTAIFKPYTDGEAANLSLHLYNIYGNNLTTILSKVEEVLLYENDRIEKLSLRYDNPQLLTNFDINAQKQAWITEKIYDNMLNDSTFKILSAIWEENYSATLSNIKENIQKLNSHTEIQYKLCKIALSVCESAINATKILGCTFAKAEDEYLFGKWLIQQGLYEEGIAHLQKSYNLCLEQLN